MKTILKFLLIIFVQLLLNVNSSFTQWNYNYFDTNNGILKRVVDFTLLNNQIFIYGVVTKIDSGEITTTESIFKFKDSTWVEILDSNNLGINGIVYKMFNYKNELYFIGYFNKVNDTTKYCLAKYENSNFKLFNEFEMTTQNPIIINDIIEIDSSLILAGKFTKIGNSIVNNLVKFDGTNWNSINNGLSGEVTNLTKDNNVIYCSVIENDSTFIYKSDNNNWVKLIYNIRGNINDLLIKDTLLYISGDYLIDSVINSNYFNIRNLQTNQWILNPNKLNQSASSMCEYENDIFILGYFSLNDTIPLTRICKINNHLIESFAGMDGSPIVIKSFDSLMIVCGYFFSIDTIYCPIIALYGNTPAQSINSVNNNYQSQDQIDIKVYPNPIIDKVIFDVFIPEDGIYFFDIVSITGEVIYKKLNINYKKGKHTINIDEKDVNFNDSKILYLRVSNSCESKAVRVER